MFQQGQQQMTQFLNINLYLTYNRCPQVSRLFIADNLRGVNSIPPGKLHKILACVGSSSCWNLAF